MSLCIDSHYEMLPLTLQITRTVYRTKSPSFLVMYFDNYPWTEKFTDWITGKAFCHVFHRPSVHMMNKKNAIHFLKILLLSSERLEYLWITFSFWYFLMHVNVYDCVVGEPIKTLE